MRPAQYGAWRSSVIGGGGYMSNLIIAPSNPSRMYTYIDVGGIYRSDDGGTSWKMLHGRWPCIPGGYQVRGAIVDPRDEGKVIAAVGYGLRPPYVGVLISDDAGETWRSVLPVSFAGNDEVRMFGFVLDRHPTQLDTVLAASRGEGVWRSTDNGVNWEPLGLEGILPTDIRYDKANGDRVWLCAPAYEAKEGEGLVNVGLSGFYRSDDGGGSWQRLAEEAPVEIVQDPVDSRQIYGIFERCSEIRMSPDGGATWQSQTCPANSWLRRVSFAGAPR